MVPVSTDNIDRLGDGSTVITATRRLARELRRQYDHAQQMRAAESWSSAWPSADILPWDAWIQRLWQALPGRETLLSDTQQWLIWHEIICEDVHRQQPHTAALWNFPASARVAINAWQNMHQWKISIDDCRTSWHPDHMSFVRWALRFVDEMHANQWMDKARAINLLSERSNEISGFSSELILAGFDRLTPQQQCLIDALTDKGVHISLYKPAVHTKTKPIRLEAVNTSDEWKAAATWARQKVVLDPDTCIAIIVPDLHKHRSIIKRQLRLKLLPESTIQQNVDDSQPFHISLGKPLSAYPIINDALALLALTKPSPQPYTTISQLLRSSFLHHRRITVSDRDQLEIWCRRHCPWQLTGSQLIKKLRQADGHRDAANRWINQLDAAFVLRKQQRNRQPFNKWMDFFNSWLNCFGWPGDIILNSQLYQTVEAWHDLFFRVAALDHVMTDVGLKTALNWLHRSASSRIFQPQAQDAPIQVMDVNEAAGFEFDAVWFGGLTENDWPPAASPNPFLPPDLQRKAGMESASTELIALASEQKQQRLIDTTDEIVMSSHLMDGEVQLEPSYLISPFAGKQSVNEYLTSQSFVITSEKLETYADDHGHPLAGSYAYGGVAVITDQAACPFRAYARHRLAADFDEPPQAGIDAIDRGTLVHSSLELIWEELADSQRLKRMADEERSFLIEKTVKLQLRQLAKAQPLPENLNTSLKNWLSQLLENWLTLEKSRALAFSIDKLEDNQQVMLAGMSFNVRIDRIDRLEDGSLSIIDYKTSKAELSAWGGERQDQPQLPLYVLAQRKNVNSIAFAQVRSADTAFIGLCRERSPADGINTLAKVRYSFKDFDNWDDLLAHWHETLIHIAEEYKAGLATVTPKKPATCAYCNLHQLCRIGDDAR